MVEEHRQRVCFCPSCSSGNLKWGEGNQYCLDCGFFPIPHYVDGQRDIYLEWWSRKGWFARLRFRYSLSYGLTQSHLRAIWRVFVPKSIKRYVWVRSIRRQSGREKS